ncbi:MAG: hypothetical protein LBD06_12365 [Candidatus Accumulibacter sp.]|nr:hypothetical protein [Accumulibacter sp.]
MRRQIDLRRFAPTRTKNRALGFHSSLGAKHFRGQNLEKTEDRLTCGALRR